MRGRRPDPLVEALLPVGKDCDCGFPLVWRRGEQWCSVYGSHPVIVTWRNRSAYAARLVDELDAMSGGRRGVRT